MSKLVSFSIHRIVKQAFLILFVFALAIPGFAQDTTGKMMNRAFKEYKSGNYRSALALYRQLNGQKTKVYYMSMISLCYVKMDSTEQAKQEDIKIVAVKEDDQMSKSIQVQVCDALAKLYLKDRDYKMSLYYDKLYADMFMKARFADVNRLRFHFFNVTDQARCFVALGQVDSAIVVMTPYMFCDFNGLNQFMLVQEHYRNPEDSLKNDTVCRFYVSLLQQKYSKKQIKAEFKKAEKNLNFLEERHDDSFGFLWENITCSIDIYGQHFIIYQKGIGDKKEKLLSEINTPEYTKAYHVKRFHDLPVCRIVQGL